MLKLQFNLRHQDIYLVNRGEVVATDSKNYLVAHFNTLTDDWETPLTAIFTDDKHKQPYAVIVGASEELEENECFVPWEVLTDECNVYVSVYCGNLHTTVTAAFRVQKSGYVEGETPPPPSPTVYDIIIQAIEDLRAGKQDKLIAGENITISGNVISASGGVTSYADLKNKPQINGNTLLGNKSSDDLGLQKKVTIQASSGFDPNEYLFLRNNGVLVFNSQFVLSIQDSGFPKLSYWGSVNGVASITTSSIVSDGLTVGINGNIPISEGGAYYRFCTNGETRKEIYLTDSGKAYQKLTTLPGGTWVEGQWQEIGSGSQIVSGVVNQNGTITFTDSDGNTFTTTGSSVIGADGFSPTATVTQTSSGATISITDATGTTTANISNGADYVLTNADKQEIAQMAVDLLPNADTVSY